MRTMTRKMTTTSTTTMTRVSQLWDQIETWCFCEDINYIQGHQPFDDDKVEDNDKDVDNYKEDNDDKGISALGLDIVLGFSLGHLGH